VRLRVFPAPIFTAADKFLKDHKAINMNGFGVPFFPRTFFRCIQIMTAQIAGEV
jgi:hypothetical protein